ncbi:MAG: WG repeat-containing protein [Flavobacteriales bacterium]|nr:WG repeat-containing protein [Flavobacteriales bacterium]
MNRYFIIIVLFSLCSTQVFSQFPFSLKDPPKETPDTLYFPVDDGIQLVVINRYDTWKKVVDYHEMTQPRALSWSDVLGPAPSNTYIFRNEAGKIIKMYNSQRGYGAGLGFSKAVTDSVSGNFQLLKAPAFVNASEIVLYSIEDYRLFNEHLRFQGDSGFVGIIDLRGEIVVPPIYHGIRPYQDRDHKNDKYIVDLNNKYGMLDSNFNVLFDPIYSTRSGREYSNLGYPEHDWIYRYLAACKEKGCGLISVEGEVMIPFKYDHVMAGHDTTFLAYKFDESLKRDDHFWISATSCVVYDKNFDVLGEIKGYDRVQYYGVKCFLVSKKDKLGVLDHFGESILAVEYDDIGRENGAYVVSKDGMMGIISLEGDVLLPLQFESLDIYGSAIFVTKNGLVGVYSSKDYSLITEPQFQRRHWDMGKYILTDQDGRQAYVQFDPDKSFYVSRDGEKQVLWEKEEK